MPFEFGTDGEAYSIGQYLRHLREGMELTLAEVSRQTKIHERFLQAIEEDDKSEFSNPVYWELFLKSYSEFLGVRFEEIQLRLPEQEDESSESEDKADKAKTKPSPKKPLEVSRPSKGILRRFIVVAGAIIVVVLLAVAYFEVYIEKSDVSDRDSGLERQLKQADTMVEVEKEPAQVYDSMYLMIAGKSNCWIDLRIDSDSVFSGFMRYADTMQFALEDSIYLKLGRANAITAWLNGIPLELAMIDDSSTASFNISRSNYMQYVDSGWQIQ